jgi:aminoglycoside N3'-acetyltransferase
MSTPPSVEVLHVQYQHISEQLAKVIQLAERSASREEMREADQAIRAELREVNAETKALATRTRALEDARNSTESLVNAAKWVIGLGGSGLLAVVAKYLLSTGG